MTSTNEAKMKSRQSKQRRKIKMKRIEKKERRQVSFTKRRAGLFKKATELAILCGAQIAIVVFSAVGNAFSFGNPSVDTIINRFCDITTYYGDQGGDTTTDMVHEANLQHDELRHCIDVEIEKTRLLEVAKQRESGGRVMSFLDTNVWEMGLNDLQELFMLLKEQHDFIKGRENQFQQDDAMHIRAMLGYSDVYSMSTVPQFLRNNQEITHVVATQADCSYAPYDEFGVNPILYDCCGPIDGFGVYPSLYGSGNNEAFKN